MSRLVLEGQRIMLCMRRETVSVGLGIIVMDCVSIAILSYMVIFPTESAHRLYLIKVV